MFLKSQSPTFDSLDSFNKLLSTLVYSFLEMVSTANVAFAAIGSDIRRKQNKNNELTILMFFIFLIDNNPTMIDRGSTIFVFVDRDQ